VRVVAVLVLALAAVGCRQLLGIDDTAVAEGDAPSADGRTGDASASPDAPESPDAPAPPDAVPCTPQGLDCDIAPVVFTCAGSCWVGCDDTVVTQPQAAAQCAAWGGRLAWFDSPAENACWAGFTPVTDVWIGLRQDPGQQQPDDAWSWHGDGAMPAFLNWADGEPNDLDKLEDGDQQCSKAYPDVSRTWDDETCGTLENDAFLCRR
jgi:hypothetical protein